ncbi:MAG: M20 family metallo-hydrolase [Tissierellia bacterium]|nr:M20 family metallo-hydrolase [Tissierellia bacterium]
MYSELKKFVDGIEEELIYNRRDFHKNAESGWNEYRTSAIIAKKLEELGYEVVVGEDLLDLDSRMGLPDEEEMKHFYDKALLEFPNSKYLPLMKDGKTGVMGIYKNGGGPVIAMRFDIDALGVEEDDTDEHIPFKCNFASINENVAHACGHDGHASIGLGVAKTLMKFKDDIKGTVKLIFQPAEEGVRGAKSIVEKGHLDDVKYFLGSHISGFEEDEDIIPGSDGALATTKLDVTFTGKASHAGGSPQIGKNAAMGMATAILNLYAIPRHSKGATRINVGYSQAGTGRNVIPETAIIKIETRGETTEINDYVRNYALRICESAANMHDLEWNYKLMGEASSMISDKSMMDRVRSVSEKLGLKVSKKDFNNLGGSEDVSYMLSRVQEKGGVGTFLIITTKTYGPAHNRRFDFEESVLKKGVLVFSASVLDIFN